jgi:hypothetical protein
MDCPICHDAINADSGITTLACSHSYHLKCITRWISEHETCPCCRKEVGDYEKIHKKSPLARLERTQTYMSENAFPDNIDAMIDEVIQELAGSVNLPVSRWIRLDSGLWVRDDAVEPREAPQPPDSRQVPVLTLPPHIQRLNIMGLNPDAPPFYPAAMRS